MDIKKHKRKTLFIFFGLLTYLSITATSMAYFTWENKVSIGMLFSKTACRLSSTILYTESAIFAATAIFLFVASFFYKYGKYWCLLLVPYMIAFCVSAKAFDEAPWAAKKHLEWVDYMHERGIDI